jgi:hypothetical protein
LTIASRNPTDWLSNLGHVPWSNWQAKCLQHSVYCFM